MTRPHRLTFISCSLPLRQRWEGRGTARAQGSERERHARSSLGPERAEGEEHPAEVNDTEKLHVMRILANIMTHGISTKV